MSGTQAQAARSTLTGGLLTAAQVAERWQVPKGQVYRVARDGALPCIRIGKHMRFRLESVERFELEGGADR